MEIIETTYIFLNNLAVNQPERGSCTCLSNFYTDRLDQKHTDPPHLPTDYKSGGVSSLFHSTLTFNQVTF